MPTPSWPLGRNWITWFWPTLMPMQSHNAHQIHPNAVGTGARVFRYFCADGDTAARLHMLNISDERIHPVGSLQSQTSVPALLGIQTNLTSKGDQCGLPFPYIVRNWRDFERAPFDNAESHRSFCYFPRICQGRRAVLADLSGLRAHHSASVGR